MFWWWIFSLFHFFFFSPKLENLLKKNHGTNEATHTSGHVWRYSSIIYRFSLLWSVMLSQALIYLLTCPNGSSLQNWCSHTEICLDSKALCQVSRHINPTFGILSKVLQMHLLQWNINSAKTLYLYIHCITLIYVYKNDNYLMVLYFVFVWHSPLAEPHFCVWIFQSLVQNFRKL